MVATLTAVVSYPERTNPLFTRSLNCQEGFQSLQSFNVQHWRQGGGRAPRAPGQDQLRLDGSWGRAGSWLGWRELCRARRQPAPAALLVPALQSVSCLSLPLLCLPYPWWTQKTDYLLFFLQGKIFQFEWASVLSHGLFDPPLPWSTAPKSDRKVPADTFPAPTRVEDLLCFVHLTGTTPRQRPFFPTARSWCSLFQWSSPFLCHI